MNAKIERGKVEKLFFPQQSSRYKIWGPVRYTASEVIFPVLVLPIGISSDTTKTKEKCSNFHKIICPTYKKNVSSVFGLILLSRSISKLYLSKCVLFMLLIFGSDILTIIGIEKINNGFGIHIVFFSLHQSQYAKNGTY